ncbi:MAG: hypothetical protein OEY23_20215 [Acidimicrobiia bacterium]|nr:hypothetical protein [Acidimicrobiia bacterium]
MLNLLHVAVGARVLLADGASGEVVENPADGQWLAVRRDGQDDGELVHAQDIVGLAD